MPRSARIASQSGFYHVTMRGNAKGLIFETDEHRRQFLKILTQCRDNLKFRVIAWCLMDNHVHLVLDMCDADLTEALHWIGTTYACYFNRCEERVGHLFQCPFGSKPINYEGQLLNTVKYVHMNPQRAGICAQDEYTWSSYAEYALGPNIVDTSAVLGIAGGKDSFFSMSLDLEQVVRLPAPMRQWTDQEALVIAKRELGEDALHKLQQSGRSKRNQYIYLLKARGLSSSQIARLCFLSERTVRRITLEEERRLGHIQSQGKRL